MPTLVLHYHPLSSYCHKVLIALDVLEIDVDKRVVNPGDAAERATLLAWWPTGKIPLLVDGGRPVPETSPHDRAPAAALCPSQLRAAAYKPG